MTGRAWQWLLWSALGLALAGTAYLLVFTTFMFYDDEGYVLLTLRDYLAGGRLYDEIFTQYGPWPYLYHQIVSGVTQLPLTHTLGRYLTILHWVAAAGFCGAVAARLTGRTVAAVVAMLASFGLLWQMVSEPSHPGSLISLMVGAAMWLTVVGPGDRRPALIFGGLGMLTTFLLLTKVNVGLLLLAGWGCGLLRFTAWPERWRTPASVVATVGLLLVPWALMGRQLSGEWPLIFAFQFTLGAAALLWVTPPSRVGRLVPSRAWLQVLAGLALGSVLVVGAVLAHGTSISALIEGVLISPLRHPGRFVFGFTWVPWVWPVAAGAWLLAGRAGWELRWKEGLSRATVALVVVARMGTLAAFLLNTENWLTIFGVGRFIVYCLPLLPVFVLPLLPRTRRVAAGWGLAAVTVLPQVLHAFPVAGSQMGWGTFALVPFFVAGLHECWEMLADRFPTRRHRIGLAGWGVALLANLLQLGLLAETGWSRFRTSPSLDLPGAEGIRLGGGARLTLRLVTLNAAIHADVLFSRPGMFSFNLWSGVPTPTSQNATHWFWLLNEEQQQGIIARLKATPRNAVISNDNLEEFLERIRIPLASPLQMFLLTHYRLLWERSGMRFFVPTASRAVPFGLVETFVRSTSEEDGRPPVLLRANLAITGIPARVRLQGLEHPWTVRADYTAAGVEAWLEPISRDGEVRGAPLRLPAAGPVAGLFRLSVFLPQAPRVHGTGDAALVVGDGEGNALAEASF